MVKGNVEMIVIAEHTLQLQKYLCSVFKLALP